ncbi:MAG: DUF4212 domain-containing protein [Bacteroidales bacterium]|jgi:uncharacterized membrane protein|nr:DUF4212 domain-containing protein [Bacteroidales bacterium]
MEPTDQYNFSIFTPRNLHGRKNRNVIFTMLLIWAVAVFGFQFLLRAIEKPTPEKTLGIFETEWPYVLAGSEANADYSSFLNTLIHVKGKHIVKPADQKLLSEAISNVIFGILPDSVSPLIAGQIKEREALEASLVQLKGQQFVDTRMLIRDKNYQLTSLLEPYSGYGANSLEGPILASSLKSEFPASFSDENYVRLPDLMKLYLTHNQSVLTDTKFLGFPFHYFYTAVFLLILFVGLCIVYNLLIEWRLKKQGVVE